MLGFRFTNQFKKDLKLVEKRRYNLDDIFDIIVKIVWEEPLPERCREHGLSGDYSGFTECHVKNDWVIYYVLPIIYVTGGAYGSQIQRL